MHEMSIASAVLEQVQCAMPADATLIEVRIDVGELEHLDNEVMEMAWRSLVDDCDATHGSTLEVNRVPLRIRCQSCLHEYQPENSYGMVCPSCSLAHPQVLEGSGVILTGLTVDQNELAREGASDGD